jgi:hypothetical protein
MRLHLSTLFLLGACCAAAQEPWIITTPVTVTEPQELGEVIVFGGGELRIEGVPEPGVRFRGNVIAVSGGSILLEDSAIRFESTYHGQYALVAFTGGQVHVSRCDYRVPSGVQHGIMTGGDGRAVLQETDFGFVQLVSTGTSTIEARRLNGTFEVIVQDDSYMLLEDIPRESGGGGLWVWPEFPSGSVAVYTPPMPGFVESWSFPPEGSSGIRQTIGMSRCETRLWPMLVREGSDLTLRDIPEENWLVVGFHMPVSQTVAGLHNQDPLTTQTLPLTDRTVRLENASIDTWNLYPEGHARVEVRDSLLGEILAFGDSRVRVVRSVVDGTGGFFGSGDRSWVTVEDCGFTCDIQATQDSTMVLRDSTVAAPDFPGAVVRIGAYDRGRLLLDQTVVDEGRVVTALGGQGLIGLAALGGVPAAAPGPGETASIQGWAGIYTLDPEVAGGSSWELRVQSACGGPWAVLGSGKANVEGGELAAWSGADPGRPYILGLVLTDGWGRVLHAGWEVAPELIPSVCGPRRGGPRPAASR